MQSGMCQHGAADNNFLPRVEFPCLGFGLRVESGELRGEVLAALFEFRLAFFQGFFRHRRPCLLCAPSSSVVPRSVAWPSFFFVGAPLFFSRAVFPCRRIAYA